MSWETHPSQRLETLPADWPKTRRRVIKRDRYCQWGSLESDRVSPGYRCTWFSAECDHKDDPLDHSDENLRGLCKRHHGIRSGRQGAKASGDARSYRARAKFREPGPHPGLFTPEEIAARRAAGLMPSAPSQPRPTPPSRP